MEETSKLGSHLDEVVRLGLSFAPAIANESLDVEWEEGRVDRVDDLGGSL